MWRSKRWYDNDMKQVFAAGISALAFPLFAFAQANIVTVSPQNPIQGDPLLVTISASNTSEVASVLFNGKPQKFFAYKGSVLSLIPLSLTLPATTTYPLLVTLGNGTKIQHSVVVGVRPRPTEAVAIPKSLGGNTSQAGAALLSLLDTANSTLANLKSNERTLWKKPFDYPVATPVITDTYGVTRDSGGQLIAHKGIDFWAPLGTPVRAMNRGVVRLARTFTSYGKTVVVDHGQGVFTYYMHLSKISVSQGAIVEQGDLLGKSGQTGYSEGPHLHVSVRVGNESIDPEVFMELLGATSIVATTTLAS